MTEGCLLPWLRANVSLCQSGFSVLKGKSSASLRPWLWKGISAGCPSGGSTQTPPGLLLETLSAFAGQAWPLPKSYVNTKQRDQRATETSEVL